MAYGNGESGGMASGTLLQRAAGRGDFAPTPATLRPAVIAEQAMTLEKMTEQMHGLISELEARICAVLQPEPPTATSNKLETSPAHTSVPLGNTLGQMNDRLQVAANRLRNIIERVEL